VLADVYLSLGGIILLIVVIAVAVALGRRL
jgi:hypothetical protein